MQLQQLNQPPFALALVSPNPSFKPLYIDFLAGKLAHRRQYGGGKQQDLAKACGLHQHGRLRILDCTAGLGRDAFVLAGLGAELMLCERHPWLQALLQDALSRAKASGDPLFDRMQLQTQDVLQSWPDWPADVVYLDPMFPSRDKSALVKKDMQILHQLLAQSPDDSHLLLPRALASGAARVVVKRPALAPFLNDQEPSYSLKGKAGRFDVYALRKLGG